jgi:hypothetical protein
LLIIVLEKLKKGEKETVISELTKAEQEVEFFGKSFGRTDQICIEATRNLNGKK